MDWSPFPQDRASLISTASITIFETNLGGILVLRKNLKIA